MSKSVSIFPEMTEEEVVEFRRLEGIRENADYQCYLQLKRAKHWLGCRPQDVFDKKDLEEILESVDECLDHREQANDDLMKFICSLTRKK